MFGTYRTVLALMVVALHLGGIPVIGAYAVFGFYALSGYLMTLIMHRSYGYTTRGVLHYALNRFLRLYPIYWLSVALSGLLIILLGERYVTAYHGAMYFPDDLAGVIRNIAIAFPGRSEPRLTPPAWALTVEIVYYIAIAAGISRRKKFVLAWFAASALYHLAINIFDMSWDHKYYAIPAASLPFATGALIFHYGQSANKWLRTNTPRNGYDVAPAMLLVLLFANWALGYRLGELKGVFFYSNFVLNALLVMLLTERRSYGKLSGRIDKWLGDLSYPIYLFHYQIGLIVIAGLGLYGLDLQRPGLTLMLVSIPFIIVVAWLITLSVDRPVNAIRDRIRDGRRGGAQQMKVSRGLPPTLTLPPGGGRERI